MRRIAFTSLILLRLISSYLMLEIPSPSSEMDLGLKPQMQGFPLGGPKDNFIFGDLVEGDNMDLVGERGRFSKVYQISPDLKMMRISTSPIHYQDIGGLWQEIDTSVTPSENERFDLETTRNDYGVYFNQDSTSAALVRFEAKDSAIEFGLEMEQPWGSLRSVQGIAEGNQVIYQDIFSGVDLRYQLSSLQMLEEFIVKQPSMAEKIFEIRKQFRTAGTTWTLEADGSIRFHRA